MNFWLLIFLVFIGKGCCSSQHNLLHYKGPDGNLYGPFPAPQVFTWWKEGYFADNLPVSKDPRKGWMSISDFFSGRNPTSSRSTQQPDPSPQRKEFIDKPVVDPAENRASFAINQAEYDGQVKSPTKQKKSQWQSLAEKTGKFLGSMKAKKKTEVSSRVPNSFESSTQTSRVVKQTTAPRPAATASDKLNKNTMSGYFKYILMNIDTDYQTQKIVIFSIFGLNLLLFQARPQVTIC